MPEIPPLADRTADAIFELYEREREDWRRDHLGASIIGHPCRRMLWYSFRWAMRSDFDGQTLRLFERGNREEAWILEDLLRLGWQVEGRQYSFTEHGGHFAGSVDGVVLGVPDAPKTWHLLEVKTANEKQFENIQRRGVLEAKPQHFAQMQVYMHELGLKRALYLVVCKNDDRIYTERIDYDRAAAETQVHVAKLVVESTEPLTRISDNPEFYICKHFCKRGPICHEGDVAELERNCRTCASSTPRDDGTWHCEDQQKSLSPAAQREGCDRHLFIPELLPWAVVRYEPGDRCVVYEDEGGNRWTDRKMQLARA